jgi:imidazolonepropionase-like amidohydrolase
MMRPLMFARDAEDTADGEAGVRRLVRRHVQWGADCIKFATTGGIASEGDEPDWVMYSEAEVAALVEEAHAMKHRTACHAYTSEGINRALRAGTDTLEHGTYLDDAGLERLLANKTFLIPTFSFFAGVLTRGRELNLPAYWMEKCAPAFEAQKETVRKVRRAGGRVALGTDAAGGRHNPHGDNARELALWPQLGFTPEQVLAAATSVAAEAIGVGEITGRIAPGYSADLLFLDGDPLEDLSILADKPRIKRVIVRGRIALERE